MYLYGWRGGNQLKEKKGKKISRSMGAREEGKGEGVKEGNKICQLATREKQKVRQKDECLVPKT